MRIFVIGAVRNATPEFRAALEKHVAGLEAAGHKVHLPHRDTNQVALGSDICYENLMAIRDADEIHLFYTADSKGTHFDLGMAFALDKRLVVVKNVEYGPGKSFPRMVDEWAVK